MDKRNISYGHSQMPFSPLAYMLCITPGMTFCNILYSFSHPNYIKVFCKNMGILAGLTGLALIYEIAPSYKNDVNNKNKQSNE
jgi:hypothetical protein